MTGVTSVVSAKYQVFFTKEDHALDLRRRIPKDSQDLEGFSVTDQDRDHDGKGRDEQGKGGESPS